MRSMFNYLSLSNTLERIILNCHNLINFLENLENAVMFSHFCIVHSSVISLNSLVKLISRLSKIHHEKRIHKFHNPLHYYEITRI